MKPAASLRDLPGRATAGAFFLHEGMGKWKPDPERAMRLHSTAAGAFPFLQAIPPETFQRLLSITEMTVGGALLAPFVPRRVAGLVLTGMSAGLFTMYLRTPSAHKEGSIWPTPTGMAMSKDMWLLGIGLSLLAPDPRRSHD